MKKKGHVHIGISRKVGGICVCQLCLNALRRKAEAVAAYEASLTEEDSPAAERQRIVQAVCDWIGPFTTARMVDAVLADPGDERRNVLASLTVCELGELLHAFEEERVAVEDALRERRGSSGSQRKAAAA